MLSSIHPFGERARHQHWWITATAYLIGSMLGGATIGVVLGLLGSPLPTGGWSVAVVAGVSIIALGVELTGHRPPSWHRQVNEEWLDTYRGWVYGLGFGFQLGLGVVTIVTTTAVYVMLVAALLSGSALGGLVVGATFGFVRGAAILATARVDTPERLRGLHRGIVRVGRAVRPAATASIAAISVVAVSVAVVA